MSSAPRPLPLIALAMVACLAFAGCSRIVGPRTWTATAELAAGGTTTVSVRDDSGRIDNVEIDPAGVNALNPVANPPGQPNVVLVSWAGGACDRATDIVLAANGSFLDITIRTTLSGQVCDAMAIGHVLRLTAIEPLPAAAVRVSMAPAAGG